VIIPALTLSHDARPTPTSGVATPRVQLQDEIENTTIQFQRIGQAQLNVQKENVTAITRQLQARVTGTITVLNATFGANATLIDANARAAVLNLTSVAEATSYNAFKTGFSMSNQEVRPQQSQAHGLCAWAESHRCSQHVPSQVLTVTWFDTLINTKADRMFISTDVPPLARPNLG